MIFKITTLKILNQIAGIVTTLVLVAILAKEEYGLYVTLCSVFLISLNTYNVGAAQVEARQISQCGTEPDTTKKKVITKTTITSAPIIIIEIIVLILIFPELATNYINLLIFVPYFAAENLKYILSGYFRGAGKVNIAAALVTFPAVLTSVLLVLSITVLTEIYQVFMLRTLSSLLVIGYTYWLYPGESFSLRRDFFKSIYQDFFEGLKVGLSSTASQVFKNSGILLIAALLGYAAVATYKISFLVAFPMTIPAFLMSAILVKPIGKAIKSEGSSSYLKASRKIQIINLVIFVPNILIALNINSVASHFTTSLKMEIDPKISVFVICTLFIQNAFGPTNLLLHLQGRSWLVLVASIIGAGINLAVSYVLIYEFGILGAVIGTLIGMTFIQVVGRINNNKISVIKNCSIETVFHK